MKRIVSLVLAIGLELFIAADRSQAATLTTLHIFNGPDGNAPVAALALGTNGNFYGTTEFGGVETNDCVGSCGTVFEISPGGAFTSLHLFTFGDGSAPRAGLVQGSDGNLYGTTFDGGACGLGTAYRITASGVLTTISPPNPGSCCAIGSEAVLVEASDGNFYGTGGAGVFQITLNDVCTTLNVQLPESTAAGLVQGTDGFLYGTTQFGGTSTNCSFGCGTVFKVTTTGELTILHSFDGSDGKEPVAALVQGSDGDLYGTTSGGLTSLNCSEGCGTVFKITTNGEFTTLYAFSGPDGRQPRASLVQGRDGNFYGTTFYGGASFLGTVFQITSNGVLTRLVSFNAVNGGGPAAGLVQDSNGDFYGTTEVGGGTNGLGTVFKLVVGSGAGGSGTNCTFSINQTNAVVAAAGGSGSVSVTTSNGCAWTAASFGSFISITSGTSGSGNGVVHYTVAANTNTTARGGSITIEGQTLFIIQAGASAETCTFTLSPASVTLAAKGGSKNVSVKAVGSDCVWTAVSDDPFIVITSGSSGTGNGKVVFTVLGNTNTTALSGTITIADKTFTVNQLAGGCTFKLSPKAGKLKATGGTGTVKVTPNLGDCDWTAVSNDPFITITAGASGTGKGAVTYTVTPNTNTTIVTGSMTIAGQTYNVTQAGAK